MAPGNANQLNDEISAYESARISGSLKHHSFRLYVTGTTSISSRAIVNVRKFCEMYLGGHYDLEVVDILQNPAFAAAAQIVAAPTLEKYMPEPVRRFVGDMSRTDRMLEALDFPRVRKEESRDS